jgi:predicted TIM-barrel fold metal-dependent hydrolase
MPAESTPEEVIEPDLEICDPHHHLMDHPAWTYSLSDLQRDLGGGHRVTSTVFVEAGAHYREDGPEHLRPVGEIAMARDAQAQTRDAACRVGEAMVAHADMTSGAELIELLDAYAEASGDTVRGVRQSATRDASPELHSSYHDTGPELYERADFRAGIGELVTRGLSLDTWQYYHQLPALIDLARAFPDLRILVDHVGGVAGLGPYAGRHDEIFPVWRGHIRALAELPNVWMKLGGLGMSTSGFDYGGAAPNSATVAAVWRPYIATCLEAFGPERSMFESNFPIDRHACSYRTLWNALKRLAAGASAEEKALLFRDTARRFYGMGGR